MTMKPIPNFPRYFVSKEGDIYGKRGKMTPYSRKDGYFGVKLFRAEGNRSIRKGLLVHRLVAKTFIPNPEKLPVVNHKNGDKKDNRVENLEWCSYKHNTRHAWDNGLISRHERRVMQITSNGIGFEYDSILEAAKMSGVPFYGISKACRGTLKTAGGYWWVYIDDKDQDCVEDIEKWEIIEEFPDYKVSKDGKIYTTKRKKVMKTFRASYTRVKLFKNGKPKMRFVHTLVAKAYIPNPENKSLVNHKNGDRHDNRVENLEWMTHKENAQHACDNGLCPKPKGKPVIQLDHTGSEITRFNSLKEAAAATGAHPDTITLVCKGIRKRSGGWKWEWDLSN